MNKVFLYYRDIQIGTLEYDGENYIYNSHIENEKITKEKYGTQFSLATHVGYDLFKSENVKSKQPFKFFFRTWVNALNEENQMKYSHIEEEDDFFTRLLKYASGEQFDKRFHLKTNYVNPKPIYKISVVPCMNLKNKIELCYKEFKIGTLMYDGRNYIYSSDKEEKDAEEKYGLPSEYNLINSNDVKSEEIFEFFIDENFVTAVYNKETMSYINIEEHDHLFTRLLKYSTVSQDKFSFHLKTNYTHPNPSEFYN